MASQPSFDVVSLVNLQEVDNAVNQAIKELGNRFDFKGSKSSIKFIKTERKILLIADDDLKLRNIQDILKTRMAARKIPIKSLKFEQHEKAFEGTLRQEVTLVQGIEGEKARSIVRLIKESKLKVQATIQEDQVRVSGKSKDDLQEVMRLLRESALEIPLQFTNFR